jgi:hypothetical protein
MPVARRFPDWDPRSWSEPFRDPPTKPVARPIGLDDEDPHTPLFDALWRIHGRPGRHALNPDRRVMARHHDDDADGVANQADPDWRPDARDEHAHDDEACDQAQAQPDRWIGVQRDPDLLPIGGEVTDG